MPPGNVEVAESKGGFGNFAGYGGHGSRFDKMDSVQLELFGTPGWQRAQKRGRGGFEESAEDFDDGFAEDRARYANEDAAPQRSKAKAQHQLFIRKKSRLLLTIEGELIAKSTGTVSPYAVGDRVFHLKFGNGNVTHVDGNKLTIAFDRAGEKRVVDSFVERCVSARLVMALIAPLFLIENGAKKRGKGGKGGRGGGEKGGDKKKTPMPPTAAGSINVPCKFIERSSPCGVGFVADAGTGRCALPGNARPCSARAAHCHAADLTSAPARSPIRCRRVMRG